MKIWEMKIWEIDWKQGKKYICDLDERIYQVGSGGEELLDYLNGENIKKRYSFRAILLLNFEEMVDWSKVEIDTKVLITKPTSPNTERAYFAGIENGMPAVFSGGCTSFTVYQELGDSPVFIPETIELYREPAW